MVTTVRFRENELRPPRILLVSTSASAPVTANELRNEGYEVVIATSLAAAWSHLAGQDRDLVITPVELEDGNGLELLEETRRRSPSIPVILLATDASSVCGLPGVSAWLYGDPPTEQVVKAARLACRRTPMVAQQATALAAPAATARR